MSYKIKEIADMAGISVRTLHHYDQIGLLTPSDKTESGYRIYIDEDLEKLQQILFFKELDFPLKEIKKIMDDPNYDRKRTLKVHRELLLKRKIRLDRIIESLDNTLNSIKGGVKMDSKKMFDSFDMKEIEKYKENYKDEVKQKYGETEAHKESMKKISQYKKEDWRRIHDASEKINAKIVKNMDKGPSDPIVQQGIGEFRKYITDNFYNCTPEILRGLGEMYVTDERFTKNLDKHREGYSKFLREAINIYCNNIQKQ